MKSGTSIFSPSIEGEQELFVNWAPDSEVNGYDGDTILQNTEFYFFIQHDSRLKVKNYSSSMGTINYTKEVSRKQIVSAQRLHGKDANTVTLSWVPSIPPEITWFGDYSSVPKYTINERIISVNEEDCPVCLTAIYNFTAKQYKFIPSRTDLTDQDDEYPVAIRFFMEKVNA
jgi:hypothetical protein